LSAGWEREPTGGGALNFYLTSQSEKDMIHAEKGTGLYKDIRVLDICVYG
jgi:hypothetical protein